MNRDALVVGINQYPFLKDTPTSQAKHLATPVGDAEVIARRLEEEGGFRVRRLPEIVKAGQRRVDPKSSQLDADLLENAIVQLFNPSGNSIPETALFYFSGHGLRKERGGVTEGFLATSDANPRRKQWGVSLRWLRELLQKSPVRQQIVWLDCCFAGELLNFTETELGKQGSGRDRCFIAASHDYKVAYQQLDGKHGVLTGALLAGLNSDKTPENEWITNLTLAASVDAKLKTYHEQTKISQVPLISNHGEAIQLIRGKAQPKDKAVERFSQKEQGILLHWMIQLLEDDSIESIQVDLMIMLGQESDSRLDNIIVFCRDDRSFCIKENEVKDREQKNEFRLEETIPNASLALLVLKEYLQNLQSDSTYLREAKYKITRSDVLAELAKHGLMPTPKRTEAEILAKFKQASRVNAYKSVNDDTETLRER
ncbi:caspase family protein [Lusitaniella coriacea]|uniref:caspase family protein n=1 Tax=Lusitaniella coriacea TaxID=1983105 RepID=UPI003CF6D659